MGLTISWGERTHRNRSMEFHSLTVDSQNPRRNASDTVILEMARRMSAISVARACCTKGLSDIQKPAYDTFR